MDLPYPDVSILLLDSMFACCSNDLPTPFQQLMNRQKIMKSCYIFYPSIRQSWPTALHTKRRSTQLRHHYLLHHSIPRRVYQDATHRSAQTFSSSALPGVIAN